MKPGNGHSRPRVSFKTPSAQVAEIHSRDESRCEEALSDRESDREYADKDHGDCSLTGRGKYRLRSCLESVYKLWISYET